MLSSTKTTHSGKTAEGIVALFNASDDTIDMVQSLLTASGGEQTIVFDPRSSCAGTMVKAGAARCAASVAAISADDSRGMSPGIVIMPARPSRASRR